MNRNEHLKFLSFVTNVGLILSLILFTSYFVAPLFGGKFAVYAVIIYASWIGIALVIKLFIRRSRKGDRIRAYEYLLGCLFSIVTPLLGFRYPIGIILIVLIIGGFFFVYRAQDKRKRTQGESVEKP